MKQPTATLFSKRFLPALAYLAVDFVLSFVTVSAVYAADVVFNDNTTVTVNGHDYVILAGSEATTMDVGTTTVTATVPSGSTFTFQPPDRHVLNNDANIDETCTSSDNRLAITGPKSDVVITPDSSTLCTGDPAPSPASSPTGSINQQVDNLIAMGRYQEAWNLMEQWPHLFSDQERQLLRKQLLAPPVEPDADRELLLQQIRELLLQLIALLEQLVARLQEQLVQSLEEQVALQEQELR